MQNQNMEASFSTLIMSLGSSTIMSLGLAQNPQTGKTEKDLNIAKFNIDLLLMLQDKTKNNHEKSNITIRTYRSFCIWNELCEFCQCR